MEPSETIGQRIKTVRGELSQKAFGLRIGLSQTAVTALETNQSEPRLGTFNSIVDAFNVNPEWLRTGLGQMIFDAYVRSTPRAVLMPPSTNTLDIAKQAVEDPVSFAQYLDTLIDWVADLRTDKKRLIEEVTDLREKVQELRGKSPGSSDAAGHVHTPAPMPLPTIGFRLSVQRRTGQRGTHVGR